MAAPAKVSIDNLTGKYVMNYQLSDPLDPLLKLQGISWFVRQAISLATVTLSVRQYTAPVASSTTARDPPRPSSSRTHIDITQVASGGILSLTTTTQENRVLDWRERDHEDRVFGRVRGMSRIFEGLARFNMMGGRPRRADDKDDERFLLGFVQRDGKTGAAAAAAGEEGKSMWCDESNGRHVQSWVVNVDEGPSGGWTAEQVWGFEMVDAKRRYTRRIVVSKGGDRVERARLVYDYRGEPDR